MTCMKDCPLHNRCHAPVCPLTPDWLEGTQMRDEDVCFYLKASVEGNKLVRDSDGMSKEVADRINQALEDLSAMYGHSYIRTQIKSAGTGPLCQLGREEVSGT